MSDPSFNPPAFTYNALPMRVLFGRDMIGRIAAEAERLGCRRLMLISSPQQSEWARAVEAQLPGICAGVFSDAAMHTPLTTTDRALEFVTSTKADCTLAIGGGSAIGLGKAIAWRTDLPQIVMPTTYAGSEVTPILGESHDGRKVTFRDGRILPEVVIYDVDLTLSLPARLSATSGMNAIAHAVEALYAKDANPVITAIAEYGIAALARALPAIVHDPLDHQARTNALAGAWACGICLGAVGMALHHKLCHVLGGAFNLPHSETHAVLLPYSVAYNAHAAPDAMLSLERALGVRDAPAFLFNLLKSLAVPSTLAEIGLSESQLGLAAELAVENPYWNPAAIDKRRIAVLLECAFHGTPPGRLNASE